jgi:hypothetical protein
MSAIDSDREWASPQLVQGLTVSLMLTCSHNTELTCLLGALVPRPWVQCCCSSGHVSGHVPLPTPAPMLWGAGDAINHQVCHTNNHCMRLEASVQQGPSVSVCSRGQLSTWPVACQATIALEIQFCCARLWWGTERLAGGGTGRGGGVISIITHFASGVSEQKATNQPRHPKGTTRPSVRALQPTQSLGRMWLLHNMNRT